MQNNHQGKYVRKLFVGVIFVTAGIFGLVYFLKTTETTSPWYIWSGGMATLIKAGLILICNAFVHKIKADLIRKQKQKQQLKNSVAA